MSLNIALSSAVSSLLTIEQQMAVTSSNISNANTAGYTEKSVSTTSQITSGLGGVKAAAISSKVNAYLLKDIAKQISTSAEASINSQYYQSLIDGLGSVSSSDSSGSSDLSSALTALSSALSSLETTPDSASLKTQVVSDLDSLTALLRQTSSSIQNLRAEADGDIATTVDDVNTQLDTIQQLNTSIVQAKAAGQSTADLEDKRQTALQALAGDMNVTSFVDSTGTMQVYAGSGQSLIDETGNVHHLSHSAASSVSSSVTYASGGFDAITLDNTDITNQVSSGKLAALVNQRDTVLTNAQSELDNLAATLSAALNSYCNQGTSSTPPNSLTGSTSVSAGDAVTVASGTTVRVAITDSSGNVSSYQDIDLSSATTVSDVMSDLQSLSGVTASISGGKLVLSAPTGSGIALTTLSGTVGGTDLSSYFGLNNLLSNGSSAETISVRSDILSSSTLLPTGTLDNSSTLTTGSAAVAASSSSIITGMYGILTASRSFAASGTLGATTSTFSSYAAAIISGISTAASTATSTASTTSTALTTLQSQFSSESGVNTDQESATLVSLENNYAASAKVVSAVKAMFDALLAAVQA